MLPKVGDMWPCYKYKDPRYAQYYRERVLSRQYWEQWARYRAPLYVLLPDGVEFCLDGRAACDGDGWRVEGLPPDISVSPSIHIRGGYHGFLRNGVLT
jgi:hypothetical protein